MSEEDIARINGRRREQNRLGYAVQLCLLRYPGWPLQTDEPTPPNLLNYVGQQLGYRFAPRIQDLSDHRIFSFEKSAQYDGLKPLLGRRIHMRAVREHWEMSPGWLLHSGKAP